MSNFRIKKTNNNKKKNIKDSNTLEDKHKTKIETIDNKKNSKKLKLNELKNISKELELIEEKKNNNLLIDLNYRAELLDTKKKLELELNEINNDNEEIDYYDKAGDLILEYYDLRKLDSTKEKETKNILEYLNSSTSQNTTNTSRAGLFDRFCQRVDGIRVNKDDGSNRILYCKYCPNIEKILNQEKSSYICPNCGDMDFVIIDEDKQIKDYSPYQRRNHFKEWLNQFQAKETTDIPEKVFEDIIKELNKNRLTDISKLNRHKVQRILKKLGYNKLYEHIPFIINKITGLPAPKITRDQEEEFIKMFSRIQEPWELYKPPGRKNFLSYPYILFKFSELLELDHLLVYFPMLQPTKLMEQDHIWQKFCKHLKWEFYPTT